MNLAMILDALAAAEPDRECVTSGGSRLTYAQMARVVAQIRSRLRAVRPEGTVAYIGEASLASVCLLFGAAAAGWTFAPINYRLRDREMLDLLERSGAHVVASAQQQLAALPDGTVVWLASDQALGDLDLAAAAAAGEAGDLTYEMAEATAIALFSSGTTSRPKLIPLSHANLVSYLFNTVELASADPSEATMVSAPPYHIAWVANILSNLARGRRLVIVPHFEAAPWLALGTRERATHAMLVPTMLVRLLDEMDASGTEFPPTIKSISLGGAAASPALLRRAVRALPQVDLVVAYGLTETSSSVTILGPAEIRQAAAGRAPEERAVLESVGRPIPGVELQVRGEDGKVRAAREAGEIWVRGEQVSSGGDMSGRVDGEGWFRTRDLGYIDDRGFVFLLGRADDVIIRGGENIMPAEIEGVLEAHPAVAEAAVIGVPDEEWGEALEAAVVVRSAVAPEELRSHVRAYLAGYKVPRRILVVSELPRNSTGKLLRRDVASMLSGGEPA
jgi:acyl-CoA synthetase (AMP-forming)/AMP-acid ligase II